MEWSRRVKVSAEGSVMSCDREQKAGRGGLDDG